MDASGSLQNYYEDFAERMKLAGIKAHYKIAIAVSGGADSMALCILASQWKYTELGENAKTGDYVNGLVGLIVDHGLRAESSEEANCVQNWLSKLGIWCEISRCEWPNGHPKQGHLQETARDARYKILKDKCKQFQTGVLLVAHHADDQAELFVLRLSRHSGVAGLAGMAFVCQLFDDISSDNSILLVRPLLPFIKDDLYKICKESGQQWVEDPTNQNLAFARNKIRRLLNNFQSCNFRSEVQTLVSGCRRAREFLNKACNTLMKEALFLNYDYGYAVVDIQKLFVGTLSDLCLSRFLVLVLQFISQKHKPVRGRAIEMLMNYIRNYPCKSSLTVGGCLVCPQPGSKGLKILICFSCDSPLSTSSQICTSQKLCNEKMRSVSDEVKNVINVSRVFTSRLMQIESEVPFLHVGKTEAVLAEARRLQLISESTFSRLVLLKEEMSKDLGDKPEYGKCEENISGNHAIERSIFEKVPIPCEHSQYFMNRFVISWGNPTFNGDNDVKHLDGVYGSLLGQTHISADRKCSDCVVDIDGTVFIRHMKEADWDCLFRLVESQLPRKCIIPSKIDQERMISGMHATGQEGQKAITCHDYVIRSAREALARLKNIPIPARRGLTVLVNKKGTLLGIPSILFKCCPYISLSATFKPRIPLGGGYSSWI